MWAYLEYPLVHMCAEYCGHTLKYTAAIMTRVQAPQKGAKIQEMENTQLTFNLAYAYPKLSEIFRG
jgi:hypothetical protein